MARYRFWVSDILASRGLKIVGTSCRLDSTAFQIGLGGSSLKTLQSTPANGIVVRYLRPCLSVDGTKDNPHQAACSMHRSQARV